MRSRIVIVLYDIRGRSCVVVLCCMILEVGHALSYCVV